MMSRSDFSTVEKKDVRLVEKHACSEVNARDMSRPVMLSGGARLAIGRQKQSTKLDLVVGNIATSIA
jgi:hypothetical protein